MHDPKILSPILFAVATIDRLTINCFFRRSISSYVNILTQ